MENGGEGVVRARRRLVGQPHEVVAQFSPVDVTAAVRSSPFLIEVETVARSCRAAAQGALGH